MQNQLNKAFEALNEKLHEADQSFVVAKVTGLKEASREWGIGEYSQRKVDYYGSKAMMNLLDGRGIAEALENMAKNTNALIAKRDANIIKALVKKGITELPEFELKARTDGYEGVFQVAGHVVTITTILAGGYNIQRLHQRTITKVV